MGRYDRIELHNDEGKRLVAGQICKGTLPPFHRDIKYHLKCGGHCGRYLISFPKDAKTQVEALARLHWVRNYASWWCPACKANPIQWRR